MPFPVSDNVAAMQGSSTLIAAQVAVGWTSRLVLTNRFYALAWRFGKPRLVGGPAARYLQIVYLLVIVLMGAAIVWVRLHGFIFQPVP